MAEMYRDDVHFYRKGKPNYWVPNLNLKPENNITREIGAGIQLDGLLTDNDRLQLKGGYFGTDARNYIATRVDMKRMRSYSYNVSRARIWGWDMQEITSLIMLTGCFLYNRTESMDASSRNGWAPAILTHLSVTSAYLLVIEAFMPDGVLNFQHQPRMKKRRLYQAGYAIHSFHCLISL